jgi:predicted deacylase
MQIWNIGEGTPKVAVVGAIHGDEPCGARAIKRFLAKDHNIHRPVKLIIANEEALAENTRFIDTDLNRSIPGNPTSDKFEERLAHELVKAVDGCATLGIHSTVSYDRVTGLVDTVDTLSKSVLPDMSLQSITVAPGLSEGRCTSLPNFVDIEAGKQGSQEATDNAYRSLLEFLGLNDVIEYEFQPTPTNIYEIYEVVRKRPGSTYRFVGENFQRVGAGETFGYVDDEPIVAEETFWPVLMSETGHEEIFGYKSRKLDHIGVNDSYTTSMDQTSVD